MVKPPFTVSAQAVKLVAEISELIERYAIRMGQSDVLRLRKTDRVKTICGTLAIEGNSLSESQVSDILDGKRVVAPIRQIQEVKNAIKAYELYPQLNPFSVEDLLKAHRVMMEALADDAGAFRRGNVGVFAGNCAIHIAPPADRVPALVADLLHWAETATEHWLIRSCVFHYEFEFIHPFSDGNGRIGRLWQSLILGKLHPLFEHLPVENMIYANQQAYYAAINTSTERGDSGAFIEFMLREILNALERLPKTSLDDVGVNVGVNVGEAEQKALRVLSKNGNATAKRLAEILAVTPRHAERILKSLREKNLIRRVGSDKSGHWEVRPLPHGKK